MKNKISIFLFGLILILGLSLLFYLKSDFTKKDTSQEVNVPQTTASTLPNGDQPVASGQSNSNPAVPDHVIVILKHIEKYQKAPEQYVGGRIFQNREKKLKLRDNRGGKIIYKEWDVHPKIKGKNRGAERLITGSDQSAYFTKDRMVIRFLYLYLVLKLPWETISEIIFMEI